VLQQFDDDIGAVDGKVVEVHAGAEYVDFGLVTGLNERGATVERPMAGRSLGDQLRLYSSRRG
jgi:hypothetical protein